MDNNAKSCYYMITASIALMIIHHFEVPEDICRTVGETLEQCNSDFERQWVILQNLLAFNRYTNPLSGQRDQEGQLVQSSGCIPLHAR
jgi:hypothetical protein